MSLGLGLRLSLSGGGAAGGSSASLPEGFVHHYDFSDDANLTLSGNDITGATDLGSTGTDLAGASGKYPVNTGTINSVQAATFDDGAQDIMKATTGLNAAFDSDTYETTVAIVFQCGRTNLNLCLFSMADGGADDDPSFFVNLANNNTYEILVYSELSLKFATFGPRDANAHVLIVTISSGDLLNAWLDGSQVVTDVDIAMPTTRAMDSHIAVGVRSSQTATEGFHYEGEIGEFVVYDSVLGSSGISDLDSALKSKWGIS